MNEALRDLAGYVSKLSWDNVPEKVRKVTKFCTLDSVAAAVGATGDQQLDRVTALYQKISGVSADASIWYSAASPTKMSAPVAAFLNAMAGHTLELDDVHTGSKTHIGIVVIPAAWALAERLGSSGKDLLLAILCGYEATARIGEGFGVSSHRNRGWHATSTAGTFGAAAACAKLLKLNEDQTLSAFGLAGTQSCGLWAFLEDGSSNKVLHPARAAASGMESALLASAGMTGPEHILCAKDGGLFPAMSDEYDYSLVNKDLGTKFQIEFVDNKPYPCCRSTHMSIDAALALRKEFGITVDDVESVEVRTYLVGHKQCGASDTSIFPQKPIEAKFSTPYTVAAALIYGEMTLRQFLPEEIGNKEVQALLRKVTSVPDDKFTERYPSQWGCEMRLTKKDGTVLDKEIADASGSVKNPLTEEQLRAKALGLLREGCPKRAESIMDEILFMDASQDLPIISDEA